jgi:hypothetical protein
VIQRQFAVSGQIDIPLLLTSNGYPTSYIHNHVDKYHYFLHCITEKRVFNKSIKAEDFVPLNAQLLRTVLGKRYADEVRANLLAWGVIETDNQYIAGKKSKGFRITAAYSGKAVLRSIFKAEIWDRKLAVIAQSYQEKVAHSSTWNDLIQVGIQHREAQAYIAGKLLASSEFIEAQAYSLRQVKASTLSIKAVSAFLSSFYSSYSSSCTGYSLMMVQKLRERLREKPALSAYDVLTMVTESNYDTDLVAIEKIATQDFFLKQPDTKSRIYTNVSNLSTDLRQFLILPESSQGLINLDIRNSQPYLLSILLANFYEGQERPEDVKKYIELTSTGKFYEFMMQALAISASNRRAFKIKFFASLFFCKNHFSVGTKAGKYFLQEFPNVYRLIHHYKAADFRNLAILMQQTEANVILNVIQKQVQALGIWNLSIHDSLVVEAEHVETVRNIMLAAFTEAVGVPPTIELDVLAEAKNQAETGNHLEDVEAAEWLGSVMMQDNFEEAHLLAEAA